MKRPYLCREDGHCDATYAENERGGEARDIVSRTARTLGMDLTENRLGVGTWAPENMMRVIFRARAVMKENAELREEIARLQAGAPRTSLEELYYRYRQNEVC